MVEVPEFEHPDDAKANWATYGRMRVIEAALAAVIRQMPDPAPIEAAINRCMKDFARIIPPEEEWMWVQDAMMSGAQQAETFFLAACRRGIH